MTRMHGSNVRAYLGGRDVSGDLATISPMFQAATHDATNFASGGWVEHDPGLASWECEIDGFYDPTEGSIGRQFEDLLGASGGVFSVYDGDADTLGDSGVLFSDSILSKRGQPVSVADLVKLSGSLRPTNGGKAGLFGKLLHPKGAETNTGAGASLDNAASSANGGRANLHVTAITGTWTIRVEHSTNGSDWTTLAAFSGLDAIGGHTLEVTGTVNHYLRAAHTEDSAGSVTYILGFARY